MTYPPLCGMKLARPAASVHSFRGTLASLSIFPITAFPEWRGHLIQCASGTAAMTAGNRGRRRQARTANLGRDVPPEQMGYNYYPWRAS
jgi:hypothetical protein